MNILFLCHTVASWGGLQEWATGIASALSRRSHRVGIVSSSPEIASRASLAEVEVFDIDWQKPDEDAVIAEIGPEWDVLVTTPALARKLGAKVSTRLSIPAVATFHGVFSDHVYAWKHQFAKLVAVAPALEDMLTVIGGIDPSDVAMIPNGIDEAELSFDPHSFNDKTRDGVFSIAMASRLEFDKISGLSVLHQLVPRLSEAGVDKVQLELMGDGKQRNLFIARLRALAERWPGFTFRLRGWVDTDEMCSILRTSAVTLGAGRTAIHSLAAGTPVVGVGAREFVGISTKERVKEMLDCNFGDYIPRRPMGSFDGLDQLLDSETYDSTARYYQRIVEESYTESSAASQFEQLFLALTR